MNTTPLPPHPASDSARALYAAQDFAGVCHVLHDLCSGVYDCDTTLCDHLAMAYVYTERLAEAIAVWRFILAQQPDNAGIWGNLTNALRITGQLDDALVAGNTAVQLNPNMAFAWDNLRLLGEHMDIDATRIRALSALVRLQHEPLLQHQRLSELHLVRGDFARSLAHARAACALEPNQRELMERAMHLQHYIEPACAAHLVHTMDYAARFIATAHPQTVWHTQPHATPIKIGLLTADFNMHPVGFFTLPLWPHLQQTDIEWHVLDNAPAQKADDFTAYAQRFFPHWHAIAELDDAQAASHIEALGLHLLLDLSGHSQGNRLGVLARKPAPITATWLGYFASTGLPNVDYVLADAVCVPEAERVWWSERVVCLPQSRLFLFEPTFHATQTTSPTRPGAFVFGCFQDMAKITDPALALWAQILKQAPHAHLILQGKGYDNPRMVSALTERMHSADLPIERVHMQPRTSYQQYLANQAAVDVLLDTHPYTGGTTTVEALWMGTPTLTLTTAGMLGRQGEGLLSHIGLTDWVCHTAQEYVDKAVHWAQPDSQAALAATRAELPARCRAVADAPAFAAMLCATLTELVRQHPPYPSIRIQTA